MGRSKALSVVYFANNYIYLFLIKFDCWTFQCSGVNIFWKSSDHTSCADESVTQQYLTNSLLVKFADKISKSFLISCRYLI